ncbi:tetraacyldisaccharide 4'-kinase [Halotalea alkalilenta]|uniref:Tetraacyldisaccharide 4'-kinase n=1 Tax=Halotalea alkalilenta TaxID=376489 RepID=A0A172YFE9_9GAMM|nr:tetraacyldisaccharide 4'-kinase [Halotalea alkalilenta]ANF57944.1 tetraacyldisaccharide 4'-kinase [Halotalea alkalilenta]
MSLGSRFEQGWYRGARWTAWLTPLEYLYRMVVARRRARYRAAPSSRYRASVPVIVVGNLTVGGTGKSPLVAWLVELLREEGWRPGIVSRGYGGKAEVYPLRVEADTDPRVAGDEPVMLARQTGVPLVVAPKRASAVAMLVEDGCDIVVSDDGLQHYALERDLELVVVDGARGFGNGRCLPAGPLREPLARLDEVDAVLVNGEPAMPMPAGFHRARLVPVAFRRLSDDARWPLEPLPFSVPVHALAGIGNPERFFASLEALGVECRRHPFADHHRFTPEDLDFGDDLPRVMTAKDAVKCRPFADPGCWALDVELQPEPAFAEMLRDRLKTLGPPSHGRAGVDAVVGLP